MQQFQEWSKGQVIYITISFRLNDGMETIKVLEGWKQIIISTRIYSLSKQEKPFKQLFKSNQRTGLTVDLFGQAHIKDNSRDKQSSNPHNYFQKE